MIRWWLFVAEGLHIIHERPNDYQYILPSAGSLKCSPDPFEGLPQAPPFSPRPSYCHPERSEGSKLLAQPNPGFQPPPQSPRGCQRTPQHQPSSTWKIERPRPGSPQRAGSRQLFLGRGSATGAAGLNWRVGCPSCSRSVTDQVAGPRYPAKGPRGKGK